MKDEKYALRSTDRNSEGMRETKTQQPSSDIAVEYRCITDFH